MPFNRVTLAACAFAFAGLLAACGQQGNQASNQPPPASATTEGQTPDLKADSTPAASASISAGEWQTITTTDPSTSIQVPKGWTSVDVGITEIGKGASASRSLVRATAPTTKSGVQYVSTVMVTLGNTKIQTPMSVEVLPEIQKGILRVTPDAHILSTTLVQLPCGQAAEIEQEHAVAVGTAKVPYHQYLYLIPAGDHTYNVEISAPVGDQGVAKLQDDVIRSFKVSR